MMKASRWMLPLLAVVAFTLAGCKKEDQLQAVDYDGVKLEWPRLDTEFASPNPQLQASLDMTKRFFRYRQFSQALVELDKLSRTPNLTEPQKKLLSDLIKQTKQVMAKAPPPVAQ